MTKREAVNHWVDEFMDGIETNILRIVLESGKVCVRELTVPQKGDYGYANGVFVTVDKADKKTVWCHTDRDDEIFVVSRDDFELSSYVDTLVSWGTMWSFRYQPDNEWLENNIELASACGFRIFDFDDFGLFFGIDGGGYNFYDSHWIPLYEARGLMWHDKVA